MAVAAGLALAYSIWTEYIDTFVQVPQIHLGKLPLPWALAIVLAALFFIVLEGSYRRQAATEVDPERPFLTIHFPVSDLLETSAAILGQADYIFLRNVGRRTAFDIQIVDLSRTWNGNTYVARFPFIQLLESGAPNVPVTPEMFLNGEKSAPHSFQAKLWFCALLIGEDAQMHESSDTEVLHAVSIPYTDQGTSKSNSLVIAARYKLPGIVSVTVRDQH